MSGGTPQIIGEDPLLLNICIFCYSDVSADKICAFVERNNSNFVQENRHKKIQ